MKAQLAIESGNSSSGLRLTIIDEVSRTVLAEVKLTNEQSWQLVSGGVLHVDGQISPNLDRVGKLMRNETVILSHKELSHVTYDDQLAEAEHIARAENPGWETYTASRRGGGNLAVAVVMRKWVELGPEPEQEG